MPVEHRRLRNRPIITMSRISYSLKNVKVSLVFYMLVLGLNFFSRRIFLESLGTELVGLSDTVMSYIGFLNLAEMGISVANPSSDLLGMSGLHVVHRYTCRQNSHR